MQFLAIGSSHLFGLLQRYVGPVDDGRYRAVWSEGTPATGALDLGDGLRGEFLLYNTPAGGAPPRVQDGVLYVDPALPRILASATPQPACVFSLMRGQEYALAALVDDPTHPDFFLPGDDLPFQAGRAWVALDDARAWLRGVAAPLLGTMLALRAQWPQARLVHVAMPPPIEDEAHIRAHAEGFGGLFAAQGIKPFAMRRRLYRQLMADLRGDLAAYGIETLDAPAAVLTAAGGLRAEFARGCLHGNERYAEALAAQFKEVLRA